MSRFDGVDNDPLPVLPTGATISDAPAGWRGGSLVEGDEGSLTTGPVLGPITDWEPLLRRYNLSPDEFDVLEPVSMNSWDGWAKETNPDGSERVVARVLFSYKAKIVRKRRNGLHPDDIEALRQQWFKRKPARPAAIKASDQAECSMVVNWADWQLFKSEGGGIQATIERIERSLDATVRRIKDLRRAGRNITEIVVVNNGDPIEGCFGHYDSQLFTVQGTLRQQMLMAHDLWASGVERLVPLAEKMKFVSVLSNHGEFGRIKVGGKSITSDSDSADGLLPDLLRRTLADRPEYSHIEWHIPHDEMTLLLDISGVKTAFNHGHKVSGKGTTGAAKFMDWAKSQAFHDCDYRGVRLWVTAHFHHLAIQDFGDSWWFQCPSQDGGSKWLKDIRGAHSAAGCLTLLVGEHDPRGWSDAEVV